MSEDRLDRIEKIVESNARTIQALSNEWAEDRKQWAKDRQESKEDRKQWAEDRKQWAEDRQEWREDRKGIYKLLGQLTRSMSDFYEVQSDFYNRFEQIDERQANMTKIIQQMLEKQQSDDHKQG